MTRGELLSRVSVDPEVKGGGGDDPLQSYPCRLGAGEEEARGE